MGLEKQGEKPTGRSGKLFGKLMNRFHTPIYTKYFKNNLPADNSRILDLGCGGGKFISFLERSNRSYTIFGLDHSSEMVSLSEKVNKKAIEQNRVKIFQGSVTEIPSDITDITLATAFETVQFWPDIGRSFSEISRTLKKGGTFIIINRYPREKTRWWKLAKIKSEAEYHSFLKNNGFEKISTDLNYKKGWIVVKGER